MSYFFFFFTYKDFYKKNMNCSAVDGLSLLLFFYIEFLQPLKKTSHKTPRSEELGWDRCAIVWFVPDPVNQKQNRQVCHVSKHLWHAPTIRIALVTWDVCFRITLWSSVSKHLHFRISTPCRNVSFASAIPSCKHHDTYYSWYFIIFLWLNI